MIGTTVHVRWLHPRLRALPLCLWRWLGRPVAAAGLLLGMVLSSAGAALADDPIHVVQPGEDLYRIGLRYGVDWRAIMTANGLASTTIYPGEALTIPGASLAIAPAAPAAIVPPTSPAPPAAGVPGLTAGTYVVQRSDTLSSIAQRFHLTVNDLLSANGLANPNRLYAGQLLVIPGATGKWLIVMGHAQTLPLDCESRSAVDWAGYFGFRIDEREFFSRLPVSDDPDTGFVGAVRGWWGQTPPAAYGVYAGPVATLLQAYGVSARAERGLTWDSVRAEIDANHPVIVWVVGHVGSGAAIEYTAASNGHSTLVAAYEHTVIVTGYSAGAVTVLDGAVEYDRSLAQFLASWSVLGNMAVLRP